MIPTPEPPDGPRVPTHPKVALVNPPAARIIYGPEYQLKSITPCLGLFYLQAHCSDVAHIEVFEGEFFATIADLVSTIQVFSPDILGLTSNTSTYPLCRQIASMIECPIKIVGGPYASFRVEECLEAFDIVFVGDAEYALHRWLSRVPLESIPGIAFRSGTDVVRTPPARMIALDEIPFPQRDKMQLGRYQASPHRQLAPPFATMIATRGCGFSCSFCLSAHGGLNDGRYRERSVANVVAEIELLTSKYGIKSVQFWDDTFTMRIERTREMCRALAALGIQYVCNTRTDKMDTETAELLARSGCKGVFFGVESGDQHILDANHYKGVHYKQVPSAIDACKAAGLWTTASFIFGSLSDTEVSIRKTIRFAVDVDADYVLFNVYTAHPGTSGYRDAKRAGIIDDYTVDLERWSGEPAGVPTICPGLSRSQLHRLKAEAYVNYYSSKDLRKYRELVDTYRTELARLETTDSSAVPSRPAWT